MTQRVLDRADQVPLRDSGVLDQPQRQRQPRMAGMQPPGQVQRLGLGDDMLGDGHRGRAQHRHPPLP